MQELSMSFLAAQGVLLLCLVTLIRHGSGPLAKFGVIMLVPPLLISYCDNAALIRYGATVGGYPMKLVDAVSGKGIAGVELHVASQINTTTAFWRQSEFEEQQKNVSASDGTVAVPSLNRGINCTLFPFYRRHFAGVSYAAIDPTAQHFPSCGQLSQIPALPLLPASAQDRATVLQMNRLCVARIDKVDALDNQLREKRIQHRFLLWQ